MFKRTLLGAALVVTTLGLAFTLLPHDYSVQRDIVINAPPEAVFTYLTRLDERPKWLAWYQREPTGKAYTTGTTAMPGATFTWEGDEMGVGSATLTALTTNRQLDFALSFKKPFTLECSDTFTVEPSGTGTKLVWKNYGQLAGAQRVMALFLDRIVGPDYALGLSNLKHRLESGA